MPTVMSFFRRLFGKEESNKAESGGSGSEISKTKEADKGDMPLLDDEQLESLIGENQLLGFGKFAIAVPKGSPICSCCSKPTHSEKDGTGKIVMVEGTMDDSIKPELSKTFAMTAETVCKNCSSHLCWRCVITVGLGACPQCQTKIEEHPWHGQASLEALTTDQKIQVMRELFNIRGTGEKGDKAIEDIGKYLDSLGWDDVDNYFGRRHAQDFNRLFNKDEAAESRLRANIEELDSKKDERRMVRFPLDNDEWINVVAGSAYVDGEEFFEGRIMAECEDGEVRCIKKSAMAEMFVAIINGKINR